MILDFVSYGTVTGLAHDEFPVEAIGTAMRDSNGRGKVEVRIDYVPVPQPNPQVVVPQKPCRGASLGLRTDIIKPITCPRCASWRVAQCGIRRWQCVACGKRWSLRKPK